MNIVLYIKYNCFWFFNLCTAVLLSILYKYRKVNSLYFYPHILNESYSYYKAYLLYRVLYGFQYNGYLEPLLVCYNRELLYFFELLSISSSVISIMCESCYIGVLLYSIYQELEAVT